MTSYRLNYDPWWRSRYRRGRLEPSYSASPLRYPQTDLLREEWGNALMDRAHALLFWGTRPAD